MTAVENAKKYIETLFQNNAGGHDAAHAMRVYENALMIAETEKGCDLEIVALAALLHDADDHKLFKTQNNENARAFLAGQKTDKTDEIILAINSVSFSQNRGKRPNTIEGKIVQDADRLDAIEMNTAAAKKLAEERHQYMLSFLAEYEKETGGRG